MLTIDMDLKAKLFGEYLDNGGIEKIVFPELLEDLLKVKKLSNGKVNPDTVSPLVNAAMLAYNIGQTVFPLQKSLDMVPGGIIPVERGGRVILAGLDQVGHLVVVLLKDLYQHPGRFCKCKLPFFRVYSELESKS